MKSDRNGVSTCAPGEEQYEIAHVGRLAYVQYDFRHPDGELFTTTAPNLKTARDRRDKWLAKKEGTSPVASDSVKNLMEKACAEIQQLTHDRDVFYHIVKQYLRYIEETATYKREPLENDQYVRAKEIIEEYENRSKRSSACEKYGQSKRVHNRKTRSKQV